MVDKLQNTDTDKAEDKQEQSSSVREAILSAVKEHTKEEINDNKVSRSDSDNDGVRDTKLEVKETDTSDISDKTREKVADKVGIEREPEKETKAEIKEIVEDKAPSILPKELQQAWKDLSPDVRNYVTKTQKDLADAKSELGRRAQQYRELDAAIAPYHQAIQNWGTTPAQTVDRLFKWMDCLTGPHKYHYIQELAYNFGIDLDGLYTQKYGQQQQRTQDQNQDQNIQQQQQQQQDYVDPRIAQAIEAMYDEVTQLKNTQAQQKQNTAASYVESWAGMQPDGTYKNKPYFPQVRQLMYSLLASGAVPLVNGQLDLDTAYDNACFSNPEVRQLLLAQQEKSKQEQAAEISRKKVAEDQAKVVKAKSASHSLKPSSPSGNSTSVDANGRVRDTKTGQYKPTSVRDSLYAAIREVNN